MVGVIVGFKRFRRFRRFIGSEVQETGFRKPNLLNPVNLLLK
jgi:hypothetical protein